MKISDKKIVIHNRDLQILQIIALQYSNTQNPVSSKDIQEILNKDLPASDKRNISSATIRSIMVSLRKRELLIQKHSSSGSIPTGKGFKLIFENFIEQQKGLLEERQDVVKEYAGSVDKINSRLIETSRQLALLSGNLGYSIVPDVEKNLLKNFQLVRIEPKKYLVIMGTDHDVYQYKIIDFEFEIDEILPDYVNKIVNKRFLGKPVIELKYKLPETFTDIEHHNDVMRQMLGSIIEQLFG